MVCADCAKDFHFRSDSFVRSTGFFSQRAGVTKSPANYVEARIGSEVRVQETPRLFLRRQTASWSVWVNSKSFSTRNGAIFPRLSKRGGSAHPHNNTTP